MTFVKRGELACFAILAVVAGCRDAKELPLEAADLDCGPRVTTHTDYGVGATGTRDVTSAAEEALPDMRRPEDVLGRVQLASEACGSSRSSGTGARLQPPTSTRTVPADGSCQALSAAAGGQGSQEAEPARRRGGRACPPGELSAGAGFRNATRRRSEASEAATRRRSAAGTSAQLRSPRRDSGPCPWPA